MNYLTNYYKNICEQLEEKINVLQKQLDEIKAYTDVERKDPKIAERDVRGAERILKIAKAMSAKHTPKDGQPREKLSPEEQSFALRLSAMAQAKGMQLDPYRATSKDSTSAFDKSGQFYTTDTEKFDEYVPLEADTPVTMLRWPEKDRKQGSEQAENIRKSKFNEIRKKQAEEQQKQQEAAYKARWTIK